MLYVSSLGLAHGKLGRMYVPIYYCAYMQYVLYVCTVCMYSTYLYICMCTQSGDSYRVSQPAAAAAGSSTCV